MLPGETLMSNLQHPLRMPIHITGTRQALKLGSVLPEVTCKSWESYMGAQSLCGKPMLHMRWCAVLTCKPVRLLRACKPSRVTLC